MPHSVPDLLVEWDRLRREGKRVSLDELCATFPGDPAELRERARRLEECDRLLGLAGLPLVPADPVPDRIGGYEIRGVLGRGGMGVVYDGWDPGLKRAAAVKVLRPTAAYRPFVRPAELRARFDRERQVLGQLDHAYLVPVYGSGVSDDQPYIAMARLPGGSARDRAAELTRRGPRAVAAFVARAARGVHAAHTLGVVHRDLKPANILLTAAGEPRVSDFGLARFWSPAGPLDPDETWVDGRPPGLAAGDLTVPGVQPGTPAYMAPEQFDPTRGPVGPAADVWALGVILFELVSGARPFTVADDHPLARQVCTAPTPPCRSPHGRVPGWLRGVVNRCLAKDPAHCYPSAAALAAALENGLRAGRRRAWVAGTAGVLTLALAGGAMGGRLLRADPPPAPIIAETPFEERPEVRQALADLAAGREGVLVDGTTRAPFRWVFGPDTGRVVEADPSHLTLHTKWSGPAAAEFLPVLPPGRYRVRAELRHEGRDQFSKVGLYVGGQAWESAAGRHLHAVTLHCVDAGPDVPAEPRPAPPTNGLARFGILLTGEVGGQPSHWRYDEVGNHRFPATHPPDFRTFELVVSDAGVECHWDHQHVGRLAPAVAAQKRAAAQSDYPSVTGAPEPAGLVPGRGGRVRVQRHRECPGSPDHSVGRMRCHHFLENRHAGFNSHGPARTATGDIQVSGTKGSAQSVKVFLNGTLKQEVTTTGTSFNVLVPVGTTAEPHTIRVTSSDGKEETPLVLVSGSAAGPGMAGS